MADRYSCSPVCLRHTQLRLCVKKGHMFVCQTHEKIHSRDGCLSCKAEAEAKERRKKRRNESKVDESK